MSLTKTGKTILQAIGASNMEMESGEDEYARIDATSVNRRQEHLRNIADETLAAMGGGWQKDKRTMEDEGFVRVASSNSTDDSLMEFPLESDGTLTLSTVQSHFPNAIGLKYMAASGAWRGLRAVDNIFDPPKSGWSDITYYVTETEPQKTKTSKDTEFKVPVPTNFPVVNPLLQDMAVLGLPWNTTDEELKQYFTEQCGDVNYAEVKIDRQTGKSRGFGFIRFKTEESAQCALEKDHYLGGRKLEVKLKRETPMKLFVGRLPSGSTKDELFEYFSKFGDVTDTYVPSPFRGFGFVTFSSSDVGNSVLNSEHMMSGVRLNISKGEESKSFNNKKREACNNCRDNNGCGGGGGGGAYSTNPQQHDPQFDLLQALRKLVIEHNPTPDLKNKLYSYIQGQV